MGLSAQLVANSIQRGSTVQAWYNPLRPDEVVLSRSPNTRLLLYAWGGLFVLFLFSLQRTSKAPVPKPASAPID